MNHLEGCRPIIVEQALLKPMSNRLDRLPRVSRPNVTQPLQSDADGGNYHMSADLDACSV